MQAWPAWRGQGSVPSPDTLTAGTCNCFHGHMIGHVIIVPHPQHPFVHLVTTVNYVADKNLVVLIEPFSERGSLKDIIYNVRAYLCMNMLVLFSPMCVCVRVCLSSSRLHLVWAGPASIQWDVMAWSWVKWGRMVVRCWRVCYTYTMWVCVRWDSCSLGMFIYSTTDAGIY